MHRQAYPNEGFIRSEKYQAHVNRRGGRSLSLIHIYPNAKEFAVKNITFTIHPGEKLTIIGENGSGKSTLFKLLLRLYDPTEGRILLDGVDIREYSYVDYAALFAPMFQDYRIFEFSVFENIALKNDPSAEDCQEILDILKTVSYTHLDVYKRQMQDEVCNSILRFLTKNLSDFDLLEVGWFGGEPLCALERICSMMRKISASCLIHKVSMFSTMATNGYLLTPDVFSRLYKAGVCNYQITLDGFAPVHDYFRHLRTGGGTFERIMENLLYIKNNTQYERANILIRINVSKKLLLSLSDFVRFLADRFEMCIRDRRRTKLYGNKRKARKK